MEGFEIGPDGKPCRACVSVEEMMKKGRELAEKKLKNSQSTTKEKDTKEHYPTTSVDHHTNCPVDKDELGRSTWNLLHTMSVYYPEKPTEEKKAATAFFLENLSKTYPCDVCAEDLRKDIKQEPPNLTSRKEFAQWMCQLHNKVNGKLGKPEFDCAFVFERWKDGWKDGWFLLVLEMRKQDLWNQHADTYLAGPKRRSKFRTAHTASSALVTHARQETELQSSEQTLQAVLATFLLDFFCDSLPINSRSQIKAELCSIMVKLKLIPSTFLSDDYSAIRNAFSGLFSNVISQALSTQQQTVYKPILGNDNHFNKSGDRYQTDFIEFEQIGRGGFATVHKVKSRIDNCTYAVKKIKFKKRFSENSTKILNELHVLAQLDHKNIVRYHSGWVTMESSSDNITAPSSPLKITEIKEDDSSTSQRESDDESSFQVSNGKDGIYFVRSADELDSLSSSSHEDDTKEEGKENEFKQKSKFWAKAVDSITTDGEHSCSKSMGDSVTRDKTEVVDYTKNLNWKLIIYIQMELCSKTLAQFLSERNTPPEGEAVYISESFNNHLEIQLLSAIDYIHSKHLIHRDIKPSNIFLKKTSEKVRLLLGDFGLACVDNLEDSSHVLNDVTTIAEKRRRRSSLRTTHTVGVGTVSYAAPEQLKRKDYSHMVDIYSAGVVFFELYSKFSTDMEKFSSITELRDNRYLSEDLIKDYPNAARLIIKMTDPNPDLRPTAAFLLNSYKAQYDATNENLLELVKEKDRIIEAQKLEIKALRKELDSMKKLLKP